MEPSLSPVDQIKHLFELANVGLSQGDLLLRAATRNADRIGRAHTARLHDLFRRMQATSETMMFGRSQNQMTGQLVEYLRDASQRMILTLDVLRERGNNDLAHEVAGTPPVLCYDNELIVDGHALKRPVNYLLLRILPPPGGKVVDKNRPYMIIDPRAGHGARMIAMDQARSSEVAAL